MFNNISFYLLFTLAKIGFIFEYTYNIFKIHVFYIKIAIITTFTH